MPATALKRNNVWVLGRGPRAMLMAHGFGCEQTSACSRTRHGSRMKSSLARPVGPS